jgi:hypothetical protein
MFNLFKNFAHKNSQKQDFDLLSKFLETDLKFKNNRQKYYQNFKQKNQNEKHSLTFFMKQNLVWASCFLVMIVSFAGALNLQAQQSASQPFIANNDQRIARFEPCNVDVALPKKIDEVNTFLTASKNSVFGDNDTEIFFLPKELRIAKSTNSGMMWTEDFDSDYVEIVVNCFSKGEYTTYQKFISQVNSNKKQFESMFETKKLSVQEARNNFKWKILNDSKIQNIELKTLKESQDLPFTVEDKDKEFISFSFDQFMILQFELDDQVYYVQARYNKYDEQKNSGIDKVESYLKQIDLNLIQPSQTNFEKIEFDEYGQYQEYGVTPTDLNSFEQFISNTYSSQDLPYFFSILYLVIILICSVIVFIFINKKINQNKLKMQSRILFYSIFINCVSLISIFIFAFLTVSFDNLYLGMGNFLSIAFLSQLGMLVLDLIFNFKSFTKKELILKASFLITAGIIFISNFSYLILSVFQSDNFYFWGISYFFSGLISLLIPVWWLVIFGFNLKKALPEMISIFSNK